MSHASEWVEVKGTWGKEQMLESETGLHEVLEMGLRPGKEKKGKRSLNVP